MNETEVEKEINRVADKESKLDEKRAQETNDAPCEVCESNKFVQKFRNVVGEIKGETHGYYTLFGNSIYGYIDGYTKTLPVLSCRECGNEREIATWKYVDEKSIFWHFMHQFYFKVDKGFSDEYEVDPFFLERPLETRQYMLDHRNYDYRFYNECPTWSTETWVKAGFKIPKVKRRFLFFKWEEYPTWKELENNPSLLA